MIAHILFTLNLSVQESFLHSSQSFVNVQRQGSGDEAEAGKYKRGKRFAKAELYLSSSSTGVPLPPRPQ